MKTTLTFLLKALSQGRCSGGKCKDYFFLVGLFFSLCFFSFLHDTPRLSRKDARFYQTVFYKLHGLKFSRLGVWLFPGKFQLKQRGWSWSHHLFEEYRNNQAGDAFSGSGDFFHCTKSCSGSEKQIALSPSPPKKNSLTDCWLSHLGDKHLGGRSKIQTKKILGETSFRAPRPPAFRCVERSCLT